MTYQFPNEFANNYNIKKTPITIIESFTWNDTKFNKKFCKFNRNDFEIIAELKDYPDDNFYLINKYGYFSNDYIRGQSMIVRRDGKKDKNNSFRFFNLHKSYMARFNELREDGQGKHQADCNARKSMLNDLLYIKKINSGEIYSRDLEVSAYKADVKLGASQLSAILNTESEEYIDTLVNNLANEAVSLATDKLIELRQN